MALGEALASPFLRQANDVVVAKADGELVTLRQEEYRMAGSTALPLSSLQTMVGRRLVSASRILFEAPGASLSSDGPLELHWDDGTVTLLDGDADGESLRVLGAPWADPFAESAFEENCRYIAEHGRWRRVDEAREPLLAAVLGNALTSVTLLTNPFGRLAGVWLRAEECSLAFVVYGDECQVAAEPPPGFTSGSSVAANLRTPAT